MQKRCLYRVALNGVATFLLGFSASAQISSTFDSDADGWTVADLNGNNQQTVLHNPAGGNPAGYISIAPVASTTDLYWYAPAKFLGNRAYSSYGETFSFDLQITAATSLQLGGSGDIVMNGTGGSLHLRFSDLVPDPGFPPAAPAWKSYTVKLDESVTWRFNSNGGPIASRQQIINILSSLTDLRIHVQFRSATNSGGALDNVVLGQKSVAAPPTVASINPMKALTGAEVTITGSNFAAIAADNAVFFGGTKATVSSASATELKVIVPTGAHHGPITVTNLLTRRTTTSMVSFMPVFNGGGRIIRDSMEPKFNISVGGTVRSLAVGDLDGDGKNDIVLTRSTNHILVFQNTGTGPLAATSFASPIIMQPTGAGPSYHAVTLVDIDNDGTLDILYSADTGAGEIAILRNLLTSPGTISAASFASPHVVNFQARSSIIQTADLDGDGRLELIAAHTPSCGGAGAYEVAIPNLSVPGSLMFGPAVDISGGALCPGGTIQFTDIDGDNKPDFAATGNFSASVVIRRNTSTAPGEISFATPFSLAGTGQRLEDVDNDGRPELLIRATVRKNIAVNGTIDAGSFQSPVTLTSDVSFTATSTDFADINGDGFVEIIAATDNYPFIFENVGHDALGVNTFAPGVRYDVSDAANGTQAVDLDNDAKPDLVVYSTSSSSLQILRNKVRNPPTITGFTPASAQPGSTVTINGTNFSDIPGENVVSFGAVKATVTAATSTALTVTVPAGASYGPLRANVAALSAISTTYFNPLFSGGTAFEATSFAAPVDYTFTGTGDGSLNATDFDNDGLIDLQTGTSSNMIIFRNNGLMGTIDPTSFAAPINATTGGAIGAFTEDFDGDGRTDMVGTSNIARNVSDIAVPGSIAFDPPVQFNSFGPQRYGNCADLNKDGKVEIIFAAPTAHVAIRENRSQPAPFQVLNGTFPPFAEAAVTFAKGGANGYSVAADFDGDGFEDVAATNPGTDNFTIYRNSGSTAHITVAQLTGGMDVTTGDSPGGMAVADFDGDGKLDIAVANAGASNTISVFRNTTVGTTLSFSRQDFPADLGPQKLITADMDGDGKPDLVVVNTTTPFSFSVFRNVSEPGQLTASSFAPRFDYAIPTAPSGLAVADIDRDGRPDVVVTRSTNTVAVYKNQQPLGPIIHITQQSASQSVCINSSVTLSVTATGASGLAYQWQKFNAVNSTYEDVVADDHHLNPATSVLTLTDITSAMDGNIYRAKVNGTGVSEKTTTDITITTVAAPAPPTTTDISACAPGSFAVTAAGSTNGNYRWFLNASDTQPILNEVNETFTTPTLLQTTTVYAAIANTTGCISTKTPLTITIAPLTQPVIVAPETQLCEPGDQVVLSGPAGIAEYEWSNGATTSTITVTTAGSYTLIVRDATGCESVPSTPVIVSSGAPKPEISVGSSVLVCSPALSYQWYSGNTAIPGATGQFLTYNPAQYGVYRVVVTDAGGCTSSSDDYINLVTGLTGVTSDQVLSYPNPFQDVIHLEAPVREAKLFDVAGREIQVLHPGANNVSRVSAGLYLLRIQTSQGLVTLKLKK